MLPLCTWVWNYKYIEYFELLRIRLHLSSGSKAICFINIPKYQAVGYIKLIIYESTSVLMNSMIITLMLRVYYFTINQHKSYVCCIVTVA